ncbi:MAG: ABC-2 transporter permease [Hespellia sp.]|nr:ABC-2 transporter permease [Hespellia sp.]
MKGLFVKDLCLVREFKKFFLVIVLVALFMFFGNSHVTTQSLAFIIFYVAMMSAMIPCNLVAYDEDNHGMTFLMALPFQRKQYVIEKYLFSILTIVGSSLAGFVVIAVGILIKQADIEWKAVGAVYLVAFVMAILIISLFMPLRIKFGEKVNVMIIIICFTIGGIGYVMNSIAKKTDVDVSGLIQFVKGHVSFVVVLTAIIILLLFALSVYISERILIKKEY